MFDSKVLGREVWLTSWVRRMKRRVMIGIRAHSRPSLRQSKIYMAIL